MNNQTKFSKLGELEYDDLIDEQSFLDFKLSIDYVKYEKIYNDHSFDSTLTLNQLILIDFIIHSNQP